MLVANAANTDPLRSDLERLLRESIHDVVRRELAAFDEAAGVLAESIVLFGAGSLGRKVLSILRKNGIEPLAFTDNNPDLCGMHVNGMRVLSPSEAARKFGETAVFVVTIWRAEATDGMGDRKRQLRDLGCRNVTSFGELMWKYADGFVPHYSFDLPHRTIAQAESVLTAYDLFADEVSRREYAAHIRWRLLMDWDGLADTAVKPAYFRDDLFAAQENEVFVDCGAYTGDTLADLIRRQRPFESAVCIEPDPANCRVLSEYVDSLPEDIRSRISIHQVALGAQTGMVSFDSTGTAASAVGTGGSQVECMPLDELLNDRVPTLIKMDIEGSELHAIAGARGSIRRHRPVLAVSAYHRQNHLWRIPLMLKSISDEYNFFLRPHDREGWDLVCYAVPAERLKGLAA